jgi:NAD(P)-dependent dehydrogenase (short-subunit alcohol dehydrogenase family)
MNRKVWFITGAGRGMGTDFGKAALDAGYAVVATGRDAERVAQALGHTDDVLAVRLDVTSRGDAEAAVRAAVERFGRIDVLVNNAASFYAGYFEELTPEQMERQLATSLLGPMNVTRAVLPVMRKQRSGHIITISSSAGLAAGYEFVTAYASPALTRAAAIRKRFSIATYPVPSIAPLRAGQPRCAWTRGSRCSCRRAGST